VTLPILGNTTFWLLILMAASVVFAAEAGSQERDPTPSEPTNIGHSAEDVVSVLAKRLSLTEDQRSNLLPIIVERRRKIQEVWTSSTLFVRQKQDKENQRTAYGGPAESLLRLGAGKENSAATSTCSERAFSVGPGCR
jgi:hypothetical protein